MKSTKTTLLSSIGAGLEYYDFIIYALLSPYISQLFFPAHNRLLQLFQTFIVFALGYLIRPVGGVLFGWIGDQYGRKKSLIVMMGLMAVATLSLGCLHTYAQIGIYAPFLLLIT